MTDEEMAEIRANIAALWQAVRQLNQNDKSMLSNVSRLSHRLMFQEVATVVEQMDGRRDLH